MSTLIDRVFGKAWDALYQARCHIETHVAPERIKQDVLDEVDDAIAALRSYAEAQKLRAHPDDGISG